MAKTQEELNQLKEEIERINNKLAELSEDELAMIAGGGITVDDWIVLDAMANGPGPYGMEDN